MSNFELIEQYLNNELSAEERAVFEQSLTQNEDLKSDFEFHQNLRKAIETEAYKSVIQQSTKNYKQWIKLKTGFIFAVIIAVFIAAVVVLSYSKLDEKSKEKCDIASSEDDSSFASKYLPIQKFALDNQKDTVIETKNGIMFFIPANACVDENNVVVNDKVEFQIQEALKPADIILAGLETRTNGAALETAGMFKLTANANGKPLKLNPKKKITTQIPTKKRNPNMQLYSGVVDKKGNINWVNPKPLENWLTPIDISLLDFLPIPYRENAQKIEGFTYQKSIVDSLYFSYIKSSQSSIGTVTYLNDLEVNSEQFDYFVSKLNLKDDKMYDIEFKLNNKNTIECNIIKENPKPNIELGKTLFIQNCQACHAINTKEVGPALYDIEAKHDRKWLRSFIKNSSKMIANGDLYANKIFKEYNYAVMTSFPTLKNEEIDAILDYVKAPNNQNDQYINPSSIKAIWDKKFNNTNIATREFERRIQLIHKTCNQAILDLYIKNLDKNLYEIDLLASKIAVNEVNLKKQFIDFANLKEGKVNNKGIDFQKLQTYYLKRFKAAEDLAKSRYQAEIQLKIQYQKKKETHNQIKIEREIDVLKQEIAQNEYNIKKQWGLNPEVPTTEILRKPKNVEYYTVSIGDFGWNNIDKLTSLRETFTLTNEKGKKATIVYTPLTIKLKEAQNYDRINAYLLSDKINSYLLFKNTNTVFKQNLNESFVNNVLIIGFKGKQLSIFEKSKIKGDTLLENVELKIIDKTDLENYLNKTYKTQANLDLNEDINFQQFDIEYNKAKIAKDKLNKIKNELYQYAFSCSIPTELSYTSIWDDTIDSVYVNRGGNVNLQ